MHFDSRVSAGRRRPLAAFAAAFAGVSLLGGVVIGVEFLELNRQSAEAKNAVQPPAGDRLALEAKFGEARERTADARRKADAAEVAVFLFLNGHFVDSAEQANADPRSEPSEPALGPTIRPNPKWVTINRELTTMRQQRSELLTKLTPAHPTILALDGQIANAQNQLASIPAELPVDPSEIPADTPPREPTERNLLSRMLAESESAEEMQQTYRNLLIAAGNPRDHYRSALEAENAEWVAYRNGGSSSLALDRAGSLDLRPKNADSRSLATDDRPFPIGAISLLTVLSLFAGMLAVRGVGRPKLTFMNAAEIEATLGLPVLGQFGSDDGSRPANAA